MRDIVIAGRGVASVRSARVEARRTLGDDVVASTGIRCHRPEDQRRDEQGQESPDWERQVHLGAFISYGPNCSFAIWVGEDPEDEEVLVSEIGSGAGASSTTAPSSCWLRTVSVAPCLPCLPL